MIALLQISWRMWQWKNFENRPVFDEVMCRLRRLTFLAHPVVWMNRCAVEHSNNQMKFRNEMRQDIWGQVVDFSPDFSAVHVRMQKIIAPLCPTVYILHYNK